MVARRIVTKVRWRTARTAGIVAEPFQVVKRPRSPWLRNTAPWPTQDDGAADPVVNRLPVGVPEGFEEPEAERREGATMSSSSGDT